MADADFTVALGNEISSAARRAAADVRSMRDSLASARDTSSGADSMIGQLASGLSSVAGMALSAAKAVATFAAGAVAGGIAAGAGIAKLGSDFEQSQNQIAGFLNALGFAPQFNDALSMSSDIIRQIKRDSAALPGEANDYIDVFKAGLPVLKGALGDNVQQLTAFSNRFTAVTNTLGIDAIEAGNDLTRMLGPIGRAGVENRSFMQLLPFIHNLEGQANLTAEAFNRLTQAQRADLLARGMQQLDPMLQNAAGSFDAMWGAAKTAVSEVVRIATVPFFDKIKEGLEGFNNALMDANGELTPFAQGIVDAAKSAADFLIPAIQGAWGLIKSFASGVGDAFDSAGLENMGQQIVGWLTDPDTISGVRELGKGITEAVQSISKLGEAFLGSFMKGFSGKGFEDAAGGFLDALSDPRLIEQAQQFGEQMGQIASALGKIADVLTSLAGPYLAFQNMMQTTQDSTASFSEKMGSISGLGESVFGGLTAGIRNAIPNLETAMGEAAGRAVASFKNFLGIHSPSAVFEELGGNIHAGLLLGIEGGMPDLGMATADMGSAAAAGTTTGASAGGRGPISVTIQVQAGPGATKEDGERLGEGISVIFIREFQKVLAGAAA